MNIILFGDSLLGRLGKIPISQLEDRISGSTIYNCATGGFNSNDGAKRASYIGTLSPDVVIFSFGVNDTAPWKSMVSEGDFLRNMNSIFGAFPESRKLMLLCPHINLADQAQTNEFNASLDSYYTALKKPCKENLVRVIDTDQVVASLGEDYHIEDGRHMNNIAYELVIEAIAQTINAPIG